jgi:LysR family nitrogen assimilation transcriptional regulator
LEVRILEYFLRVVELGSINRAAAELHLSQPSLSRWLSLLEREVGTPLLIRTRQGIRVTDAGRLLVDRSAPVLRQIELLVGEVGAKARAQIALGMPTSMQRLITGPFVQQIAGDNPEMSLRVYEGINPTLRAWMEEGLLDAAIVALSERVPDRFDTVPLVREQLVLVGSRAAALRLDQPIAIPELGDIELIQPGQENLVRKQIESELRRRGHDYHGRIEAETVPLCLELTRLGVGYTVLPGCAVAGRLDSAELTAAPIDGMFLTWAMRVNRARDHSTAVRLVTSSLVDFIVERVDAGDWRFAEVLVKRKRGGGVPHRAAAGR